MFNTVNFAHRFPTPISCCALSYNRQTIACGFTNGEIKILRTSSQQLQTLRVGHGSKVTACAFSPEGSRLAILSANTLEIYDMKNMSLSGSRQLFQTPSSVCFGSDNKTLALGHATGYITLWNINKIFNGHELALNEWQAQQAAIATCAFNSTGNTIAIVSELTQGASSLNLQGIGGRVVGSYAIKTKILACIFGSENKQILLANGVSLNVFDWREGKIISSCGYANGIFNPDYVAFSPDGKRILFVKQEAGDYNFTIIATDSLLQNPVAAPPQKTPAPRATDQTPLLLSRPGQSRGFFSCFTDCFR